MAFLGAAFAILLSLAQRTLSSYVRFVRRRVASVDGTFRLAGGATQAIDAARLTAAAETALRLLTLATVALAATLVPFRL